MMGMVSMANVADAGSDPWFFTYFVDSNFPGKIIVLVLGLLSMVAWTIIFTKISELKRVNRFNEAHAAQFRELPNVLDVATDSSFFAGAGSPFLRLLARSIEAYHKFASNVASSEEELGRQRMGQVENALRRTVSELTDVYEEKMIFLASIVSGAPFLGLLGTTWGVMESFGAIAYSPGGASLKDLGPGVSGALLTTVVGLLVAIPSVFLYNYLLSRTRHEITKLENYASEVADRIELDSCR